MVRLRRKAPPLPVWIVAILMLSCAIVSVWTGYSLFAACKFAVEMQNAVPVPCTIEHMDISVVSSGDGTRLKVVVTWSYEYEGVTHRTTSERIQLFGWQNRKMIDAMNRAWQEKRPVTCFVDPESPENSVFSRHFSGSLFFLTLLFPLFFGSVAIIFAVAIYRQIKARQPDPGDDKGRLGSDKM